MREKTVEVKLAKAVRSRNGMALKFVSSGFDGVPDRLVLPPRGRIAFIELKALKAPGKIDRLVDLKKELFNTIKEVGDTEYQTILEKRYLCFHSWERISVEMGYDLRWLYRLHGKALDAVRANTGLEQLATKSH